MNTTETITMIRQTIEEFVKGCDGNIPPIAIYPFGKDGLFVKSILNDQFGIREEYLVDNTLSNYNHAVITSDELFRKEEGLVIIVSTASGIINKHICEEIKKSGRKDLKIVNIMEPIIHSVEEESSYYRDLAESLRLKAVQGQSFVRVGRLNDGGYAMINDFESDMKAYSFGISDDMSWDIQMNEMTGMQVYMYDHTVPCAPSFHRDCIFNRIGLGTVDDAENSLLSLKTILENNGDSSNTGKLILKMDIEGAEWDVLDTVPESLLKCFRQMAFEFHGMTDEFEVNRKKILRVLKKLNNTHQIIWVHGNNYSYAVSNGEITMPDAIEVLYLNRDYYRFSDEGIRLPLDIDMPNYPSRKDYDLSFLTD